MDNNIKHYFNYNILKNNLNDLCISIKNDKYDKFVAVVAFTITLLLFIVFHYYIININF